MERPQNLPGDIEIITTSDLSERGYAVGQLLSRVFHPIALNILMFLIVGFYAIESRATGIAWAMLCIALLVMPPTLFYYIRLRQGAYSDEDVSLRHQRNELYLFGSVTLLINMLILPLLHVPQPFMALLISALALGVTAGLINLFWKISVHAGSIAATAMVALLFSYGLGIALWLCALAVGWARWRTNNHTPLQVVAGFGLASAIVLVVFQLLQ